MNGYGYIEYILYNVVFVVRVWSRYIDGHKRRSNVVQDGVENICRNEVDVSRMMPASNVQNMN